MLWYFYQNDYFKILNICYLCYAYSACMHALNLNEWESWETTPTILMLGTELQWKYRIVCHTNILFSFASCSHFLCIQPSFLFFIVKFCGVNRKSFFLNLPSWLVCTQFAVLCCCESPLEFNWINGLLVICKPINQTPFYSVLLMALVLLPQLKDELQENVSSLVEYVGV